jgi:hypothetical protein
VAWTQNRRCSYRILFRYGGRQHAFTLGTVSEDDANAKAAHVDYLLMRLKQGLITIPDGIDIANFVEFDGNPPQPAAVKTATPVAEVITLATLRDRYLTTHDVAHEQNTIKTARIHFKHLVTTYGEQFPLSELTHAALQRHVDRRSQVGVKSVTIKKELATLRSAYNWAQRGGLVTANWPGRGLV